MASVSLLVMACSFGAPWIAVVALKTIAADLNGARSTPALAVNFVGETAGVIGLSYFFHKTGHHKLERLVSVVNIGSSAGAVSYGLAHR